MQRNIEIETKNAKFAVIILQTVTLLVSFWSSFSIFGFIIFLAGASWDFNYKLDHWHIYMIFMLPMYTAFLSFFTYEICSASLYSVCICNVSICALLCSIILIEIWILLHLPRKVVKEENHAKSEILSDE